MMLRGSHIRCLAVWVSLGVSWASAQTVDSFTYTNAQEAVSAWRAIGEALPVAVEPTGGLSFSIPFSGELDRVYWDHDGQWDFSGCTGFELDVSCPEPQAMRSLSIYMRSGDGWYIWNQPLSAAGRQKLILQKNQFSTEGSPAGWNNIDKVRISPWKGQAIDTTLTVHKVAGRRDSLYIVVATDSAPNAAERSVSQRTADRLGRWLKASGIPHAITTEDQLPRISQTASSIILPYNPRVPADGLTALRTFTGRGGNLVVFYSSDDQLAALMRVQLGAATNTRDIAQWRGMVFNEQAPIGVPARIHQQSWAIGPARPADTNSTIIARWTNAQGVESDEAAAIQTPHGYWFTHVLLDDDMIAKQRLLAVTMASLSDELWQKQADHSLLNAGRIDGWPNVEQAIDGMNQLAETHPNGDTIRAFTRRIGIHDREMRGFYNDGKFREAVLKGHELTDLLIKTYGLSQTGVAGEFRGVWDHDGTGWYPGDWDRTATLMAESGINAVFVNSTWTGLAHYMSKFLPDSFTFRFYGDQLAQSIKAARKHGLEVHAWIVCWNVENAPEEFIKPLRNGDRLQHSSSGSEKLWLNPAHPENRKHLLNVIEEILTNYEVDGIHLDYIRYPNSDACFSPYTRATFERDAGLTVKQWPQDVMQGGMHREPFIQWRADIMTTFVKEVRDLMNKTKPAVRLSAAVWGGYPQVITSIGQDWGSWMTQGYLDFVCPMNYANDLYRFTALADQQLALPGVRGKIYPGIGVTANESQLRGDQVVEQILALRKRDIGGFVLYDLSQSLVDDVLPTLRMGVAKP